MKRLLFILLALLWCTPVNAGMLMGSVGGGAAAVCAAPAGDELSEGFDSDPPTNTWTAGVLVKDTNLFYNHTLQADAPTGSCTGGAQLALTATSNRERIYWNRGSTIPVDTTMDIEFSIYFNTLNVSNLTVMGFVGWSASNEGGTTGNTMQLKNAGGQYQVRGSGETQTSFVNISAETWYYVKIHCDATAASSYFQITGGGSTTCDAASECAFTRSTSAAGQYLVMGKWGSQTDGADFEIGYITVSTP